MSLVLGVVWLGGVSGFFSGGVGVLAGALAVAGGCSSFLPPVRKFNIYITM